MFQRAHLLGSCHSMPRLHSWWQTHWHNPLNWAKILYALKSNVRDIRMFVKYFLTYGWSLSLIWRQIFSAMFPSLLIPVLPAPSCPSSLAGEDAGGHRLFVCTKTKLGWVIRTRHAWLSAYQPKERKKRKTIGKAHSSLFISYAQLRPKMGSWKRRGTDSFAVVKHRPAPRVAPSTAFQAVLLGTGEQSSWHPTLRQKQPFKGNPLCLFHLSPPPLARSFFFSPPLPTAWSGCHSSSTKDRGRWSAPPAAPAESKAWAMC